MIDELMNKLWIMQEKGLNTKDQETIVKNIYNYNRDYEFVSNED
jgi:hypothetical protein